MSRRLLPLFAVMAVVLLWAFLLPRESKRPASASDASSQADRMSLAQPTPPGFGKPARALTPEEIEVTRLEEKFYREFPLALKFQGYNKRPESPDGLLPEEERFRRGFEGYFDKAADVPARNLRADNLNLILEIETVLLIEEAVLTDSDLGQMIVASFHVPTWDWARFVRSVDERLGADPKTPELNAPEKLVAALQDREKRMLEYGKAKQAEASMPESIREDVRLLALELMTQKAAEFYLALVTPDELAKARRRVAR